jgi:LacI family transcriptional regulator
MVRNTSSNFNRVPTVAVYLAWFEPRILEGIASFARGNGWRLLLDHAQENTWAYRPKNLDGAIFLADGNASCVQFVRDLSCQKVLVSNADEGSLDGVCPRIQQDNVRCGRMAAGYFLDCGLRNLVCIGKKHRMFFRERMAGFTDRCMEEGAKARALWVGDRISEEELFQPLRQLLTQITLPVGIFASSDVTAVHVVNSALELGHSVPEDVAVLGANNDRLVCEFAPVPLSSIRLNFFQLGYDAARVLHSHMTGNNVVDVAPVPPVEVVERQSTRLLSTTDPELAKALHFIQKELHRPIGSPEIADHLGISANTLMRRFRKILHRTVVEEINRARVEKAKCMLKSKKFRIYETAQACGFSTPNYFNSVFRKATGLTPLRWQQMILKNRR